MSTSSPKINELIEALPIDSGEVAEPGAALMDLLGKLSHKGVPIGRLNRLWVLGTLEAKIAVAYFAWWLRNGGAPADVRTTTLNETHLKAALKCLNGMTYLRGAIMKLGQIIATHPHAAPEQFADVLGHLHFEAPPMHFSLLRELFHAELGADPEDVFDEFETEAFAAASLGQVHRARLKGSDRQVAIKIQYPGIGRTIRDDFRNLIALLAPMRLSSDWSSMKAQFEDMHRILELETDYEQEAKNLQLVRAAFSGDEGIVVPRVYTDLSTRRVLTMEYIDGVHLPEFMAGNPSQKLRDQFGGKIATTLFRLWYSHRLVYADPQPGNYIFMSDGRLGAIDYGCCCYMSDEDYSCMADVELGYRDSPDTLNDALVRNSDLTPGQAADAKRMKLQADWGKWAWEPLLHEGPFDFDDPEYFRRGIELYSDFIKRRYTRSRPITTWMCRSIYGARAMLSHLKARVDLGAIHRLETTVAAGGDT